MPSWAIEVEGLGKRYQIGRTRQGRQTLRESLSHSVSSAVRRLAQPARSSGSAEESPDTIWALRDVSFQLAHGEALGIIGHNGAGKSTLLKILSRITEPTTGEARIIGRIGSLLEAGTGFHSELTGRENTYLSGAILGMKRAEIERKFDEIVDFAEVSQFIDTPVKHYSSGMYLRLAFSVAAHLEPDVLVVDEVLAVGDAKFQKKCLGRMQSVAREGRTVLFVSHNLAAIGTLCSTAMVLDRGRVIFEGSPAESVSHYAQTQRGEGGTWHGETRESSMGSNLVVTAATSSLQGRQPDLELALDLTLESRGPHPAAHLAVDISDAFGSPLMQALPQLEGFVQDHQHEHHIGVRVQLPPLVPGTYFASLWVGSHNSDTLDEVPRIASFEVMESPTEGRTFPHTPEHGHVVPHSTISYRRP